MVLDLHMDYVVVTIDQYAILAVVVVPRQGVVMDQAPANYALPP